jgi:hypothetical protein
MWKFRIQSWADKREDEMCKLGDTRPDKDEPSYEAREPDSVKQSNRGKELKEVQRARSVRGWKVCWKRERT